MQPPPVPMDQQFIEGWDKAPNLLGEGAFGEVHLLTNRTTGEAVAMKVIDTRLHATVYEQARKEFTIHRRLEHESIIRVYGVRKELPLMYLFLEYAPGGELYDKIEPDVGLPQLEAQRYFRQIIGGVEYLHRLGIAHRDLKPENILLDNHDNIKISDFGMATIFRLNGSERKLDKRCGTLPYIAPEVLRGPYRAEPADLWSCGVILVALLTGELPWDEPTPTQPEYRGWRDGKICTAPWVKVDSLALGLLQKLLQHTPARRATVQTVRESAWFKRRLRPDGERWSLDGPPAKRLCPAAADGSPLHPSLRMACSQPAPALRGDTPPARAGAADDVPSFSQPAAGADELLLGTQFQNTQPGTGSSQTPMQRLVKRMTRFFVTTSQPETLERLKELFDGCGYTWRFTGSCSITVQTLDRRKMPLTFKASVLDMTDHVLVDFRLSKGCGLDFKRHFIRIKQKLPDILLNVPVNWSVAAATNSVP
ncbi:serine/threonine-protein kinase grp-like isoform X2 [Amphibalanus amphitrite]|nr:serine/threonine-protein kinase grp-like isoform X2 [Amphibalanus amphitrite]XP_043196274.1 serine/threonine-protein kinase grp-like isoform X2 [Amphibalanus amphitrite]